MSILISDFSNVLLFASDQDYRGSLNALYTQVLQTRDSFTARFFLNQELLDFYESLSVKKYIFTTGTVQNAPEIAPILKPVFTHIYNVPEIGHDKDEPEAYVVLCQKIGVATNEAVFVDDQPANVAAAQAAGLTSFVFENNEQILTVLKQANLQTA